MLVGLHDLGPTPPGGSEQAWPEIEGPEPVTHLFTLASRNQKARSLPLPWTPPLALQSPPSPANTKPTSTKYKRYGQSSVKAPTADATARTSPPARPGEPPACAPPSKSIAWRSNAMSCSGHSNLSKNAVLPSTRPTGSSSRVSIQPSYINVQHIDPQHLVPNPTAEDSGASDRWRVVVSGKWKSDIIRPPSVNFSVRIYPIT
jgi:hypothetical protein